jgi:GNAT superfamily N-acetyltransferase
MTFMTRLATVGDAAAIARLAMALTDEIMQRTATPHFDVDSERVAALCRRYLQQGIYTVVVAQPEGGGPLLGFAALCESHALYTEGAFGIIQEFYVEPAQRSGGVGRDLLRRAEAVARERAWRRLELCTPPLPEFERSLAFYQRNGFAVTGGRKMKKATTAQDAPPVPAVR